MKRECRLMWKPENWHPVSELFSSTVEPLRINPRPTIGWIGEPDRTQWPSTKRELEKILPTDGSFEICLLGSPPGHLIPRVNGQIPWSIHAHGGCFP